MVVSWVFFRFLGGRGKGGDARMRVGMVVSGRG